MRIIEKFFLLIRLGTGMQRDLPPSFTVSPDEWLGIFEMARKQAVTGFLMAGAQRISPDSYPPRSLLLRMVSMMELTKRRNECLDGKCRSLTQISKKMGMGSCVLKGQGIAACYPKPTMRSPGDIDLWVRPYGIDSRNVNHAVRGIISKLRESGIGHVGKATYHHVEWEVDEVPVEVHYRPQSLNNPFINRRFQRWCDGEWDKKKSGNGFFVPSNDFNAVYLLVHLYHHLLFEGVGLRQVCDYAVFLNNREYNHTTTSMYFRKFRILRFARGMMWVLREMLHVNPEKMCVAPDEKEGRFILSEIMKAGNFGQYDSRIDHSLSGSVCGNFYLRTRHRARFFFRYPSEIVWDIPFRLYHWLWRRLFT